MLMCVTYRREYATMGAQEDTPQSKCLFETENLLFQGAAFFSSISKNV